MSEPEITKEAKVGFCNFLGIIFFFLTIGVLVAQMYGLAVFFLFNTTVCITARQYIRQKDDKNE